jgi:tRNA1(Val) A37 N6-methylase TrmN6
MSLSNDAVIIDVGGGVGTISMALAREHEHLKFIIQDLPAVVEDGIQVSQWFSDMGWEGF